MNEELEQHQQHRKNKTTQMRFGITTPSANLSNKKSCSHLHINWDFPTIMFCQWMNSDQSLSQRGNLMRAEPDNDFASMCTYSLAFWRKSTYLTLRSSALCNLPSHSLLCCLIVWEMKKPFWSRQHCERSCLFCSVDLVVRAHRGHQRSRELWLRYRLSAHSPGSIFPWVTPP